LEDFTKFIGRFFIWDEWLKFGEKRFLKRDFWSKYFQIKTFGFHRKIFQGFLNVFEMNGSKKKSKLFLGRCQDNPEKFPEEEALRRIFRFLFWAKNCFQFFLKEFKQTSKIREFTRERNWRIIGKQSVIKIKKFPETGGDFFLTNSLFCQAKPCHSASYTGCSIFYSFLSILKKMNREVEFIFLSFFNKNPFTLFMKYFLEKKQARHFFLEQGDFLFNLYFAKKIFWVPKHKNNW